jgi:hypothetical protein
VKGYCPNTVMEMGRKRNNLTRQGDGEMCTKYVQNCVLKIKR